MLPAAGGPDQPYPRSLKVDFAQVVVVALSHDDNWRVLAVGVVTVAASVEALPVDDYMFADQLLPIAELLLTTGNPGRGSADDEPSLAPDATVFAGKGLRDDGS